MTMRTIAKEAGISYGALFHYFDTKEAVLLASVKYVVDKEITKLEKVRDAAPKTASLQQLRDVLVEDAVVKSNESYEDSFVWIVFIVQAVRVPELAAEHERIVNAWIHTLESLLARAVTAGVISRDLDVKHEALTLWVLCAGINQRALLKSKSLSPRRQTKLIDDYLSKLRER